MNAPLQSQHTTPQTTTGHCRVRPHDLHGPPLPPACFTTDVVIPSAHALRGQSDRIVRNALLAANLSRP